MAFEFKNLPVFSKVKIGDVVYYLKDAELRSIVDGFKDAVNFNVDTTFSVSSENLATSKAIATYLEGAIAGLTGAMHFIGVKDSLPATGSNGDIVIVGSAEYVWSDEKTEGAGWILIGDEGVYATITGVAQTYVPKTRQIAGIDLIDDISVDEIKTALGLKALAYKDSAAGEISTIDSVTIGAHTPEGDVTTTLSHTATTVESTGTYTPEGTVSGTTTAKGSVSLAEVEEGGVQIAGLVSKPAITVTPSTTAVQHIASLGTLPSYTAAQYTAPSVSESKAAFASEGVVATIAEDDAECLVFSAAAKVNALTTTGFNAGSYTEASFNAGALPSYGEAVNVVTGISAELAEAPVFTGRKYDAGFTGEASEVTGTLAGTEKAVNVSGNYDKASSAASTFAGKEIAAAEASVVRTAKTITVQ